MSHQHVESFTPQAAAVSDSRQTDKFQEEVHKSLAESGKYEATASTQVADLPDMEFFDSENFKPNVVSDDLPTTGQTVLALGATPGEVTITAPQRAAVETPQQDGGFFGVVGDIIGGIGKELTTNPLGLLGTAATSLAVSVGVGLAIVAAAPLIATAPVWVPIAGGITLVAAGVGVAGWSLSEHAPQWIKDGEVVWNASKYSAEEVARAREGLRDFGGGFTEFAASVVGGLIPVGKVVSMTTEAVGTALSTKAFNSAAESVFSKAAVEASAESIEAAGKAAKDRALAAAKAGNYHAHEYLYTKLEDPADIAAIARSVNQNRTNPLSMAEEIRFYAENGMIQDKTKDIWLKLADEFTQKALPRIEATLANPNATNLERAIFPKALAALKAGRSTEEVSDFIYALEQAAKLTPEKAFALNNTDEIGAYIANLADTNPNFYSQIDEAIRLNQVPERMADAWRTAMNSIS